MFQTIEEALAYLQSIDRIVFPTQFTYFNHCACYTPPTIASSNTKAWRDLPIPGFTIKKEMSFNERDKRISDALDYGSVTNAGIKYASAPDSIPFIIRVVIPKLENDLNLPEEYQRKLLREYRGLGDSRHAKLDQGEKIYTFASTKQDEVSGKAIDIFYGVREQDLILYANIVYEELQKQPVYAPPVMPTAKKVPGTSYYEKQTDYEFNHRTYSLLKSKDFNRYYRMKLIGPAGDIQGEMESPFEKEARETITHSRSK